MFLIGIDLGTTHCALSFINVDEPGAPIHDFPVLQLVEAGEVAPKRTLPSYLYLPSPGELPAAATGLGWGQSREEGDAAKVVGEWARTRGAQVPTHLVSSAKSWLCHSGVDRLAPLLPWGATDVPKISPVDASAQYLIHLRDAWNLSHPQHPLENQPVIVTLPASFDEAARALTVTAIQRAGISQFTLLEEPQAAFYAYTARHRLNLSQSLAGVHTVLVVDIGGGTTDFSLIEVAASPEGPVMKRLAVGDHLMLGGDNMDAALAHRMEAQSVHSGKRFSTAQWTQAVSACRSAKESLLAINPPLKERIVLPASGSSLLSGTTSVELLQNEVSALILDGFFPRVAPTEGLRSAPRGALKDLGLPYASDPTITRHVAQFLSQHSPQASRNLLRPDALLLNGGVFNSPLIVERLVSVISEWWPEQPPIRLLENDSLDLAVARGAAYYGWVRRGHGRKISGGTARSFYVGVQTVAGERAAMCLVPRGTEEGELLELTSHPLTLTLGRPVQFSVFTSSSDQVDALGAIVPLRNDFVRLPPVHALLRSNFKSDAPAPVYLQAKMSELGTLELWCVENSERDQRWRLDFQLRASNRGLGTGTATATVESMPARFTEATQWVEKVFGHKPLPVGPRDVKQLMRALEAVLGSREHWRLPILRELWGTLMPGAAKRRRSADHERLFYYLLGFSLRPGFGYPLDDWRCEEAFRLFHESVEFHREKSVWNEFWVMWRRLSGGLNEEAQEAIAASLWPFLEGELGSGKARMRPKGIQPQGLEEMVRTAASLEHVSVARKIQLGDWIADHFNDRTAPFGAWALGRLGARALVYGSNHKTVPSETARQWLSLLLRIGLKNRDGASFATAQLARLTGDRLRDLDEEDQQLALKALRDTSAPESWMKRVTEVTSWTAPDEARALGDSLPEGLTIDSV